ncbi:MAG: AAA domain-containing protein [Ktedonobacteraceae bacterium]
MTQHPEQTDCFLCTLDQRRCAVEQLSGRVFAARERIINGESLPFITIDIGTILVSLALTGHYRSLVKQLAGVDLRTHRLMLRVYHLPNAPTIGEYKERPLHRYTANSYTLAVLEPDTLLNITDLSQADYCSRQYLIQRLAASPPSAAMIRGNLVHYAFKELLKAYDRGDLENGHNDSAPATPLDALTRYVEQALMQNSIDMALAHVSAEAMREDVAPHLESLATWFEHQSATLWDAPPAFAGEHDEDEDAAQNRNQVRAETFLLAPEIGLRGRLDLFWQQASRQRFLELKTGGGANLPKSSHRSQALGYHAQLAVRRDPKAKRALATLLYSGTPGEAEAHGVPFDIRNMQRVNELRNLLVLSHVTGIPAAPPGPSRCAKCAVHQQCWQVSDLLGWQPPELDEELQQEYRRAACSEADRAFFAKFYHLLRLEEREGERQLALLWRENTTARCQRGAAISNLALLTTKSNGRGEWLLTFACDNQSELREGDEILLSDGNPITGSVVTGTITAISARSVTVWIPELIANPTLIDKYANDTVHTRTTQNLYRWLHVAARLRDLVAGRARPCFDDASIPPRADFNDEQNLAVARAVQARDYLLIQGPPGTGKTSVIAEIVKRLCGQGQRVLLAAFTNQAVDNMLTRLDAEGFHDYLRLGHERSVRDTVQGRLLKNMVMPAADPASAIHDLIDTTPVIASTTATWSSDKYDLPFARQNGNDQSGASQMFDVAIIDEASQLTMPAILGALRFARRFILVGDEQQLPPLVLSKEAAAQGLSDSLFSSLKRLDDDALSGQPDVSSACVSLTTQYRMNRWICNFSSKVFYDGRLIAAAPIAQRVLDVPKTGEWLTTESPAITRALQPGCPLVFVDVRDEDNRAPKSSGAEARAVRSLVRGLLARGIAERDIGIIAPYRAQVANIRRHLFSDDVESDWSALSSETSMSIDTVDRFQGGERMVIIMSFATTTTPEASSQLYDFLTNPHRLNVALTRAQRKLLVVGCAPALRNLPYFGRLIAYCESMKTVIG